jgi:hypothetical protein
MAISLSISTAMAFSQDSNPSFTISMAAPSVELVSGSPIRLDVTITNQWNEVVLIDSVRAGGASPGLTVTNASGDSLPLKNADVGLRAGSRLGSIIRPGMHVRESVDIGKLFDLTAPGRYAVQMRRFDHKSKTWIASNQVTIYD